MSDELNPGQPVQPNTKKEEPKCFVWPGGKPCYAKTVAVADVQGVKEDAYKDAQFCAPHLRLYQQVPENAQPKFRKPGGSVTLSNIRYFHKGES